MELLGNTRLLLIAIIAIGGVSLVAFLILQNIAENNIKSAIFERESSLQVQRAEQLSGKIGSDLQLLMTKLEVLAKSPAAQSGDFAGPDMDPMLKRIFEESNSIARIEGTGISNSKNIVMNVYQPEVEKSRLVGKDMSSRPFAIEARQNFPNETFSSGFETTINSEGQRIALLYPIINSQGVHLGWARSAVDASSFFGGYGNIRDLGSEYFAVIDKKGTILVHPMIQLEGKNYFGEEARQFLPPDEKRDLLVQKVLAGQGGLMQILYPGSADERIITGFPIQTGTDQVYSLIFITPTSLIYSEVDQALFASRLQNSLLVGGIIGSLVVMSLVIVQWNKSLKREVRIKTSELAESNKALSQAVKDLEQKEELQKQFVNIAAHELRTPIQPLLGMADIFQSQFGEGGSKKTKIEVTKPEIDMIVRNARRLERLSSDILEVARIESRSLTFNREKFDLVSVIDEAKRNTENFLRNSGNAQNPKKDLQVYFEPDATLKGSLVVQGDRGRITEVIDNLLANAVKFTDNGGSITVRLTIEGSDLSRERYAMVCVKDTGAGIDSEIMSRLFTKFVTKSEQGTGLGLFISKNIVEGHGGKIWAENNIDGTGATFTFSLPFYTDGA